MIKNRANKVRFMQQNRLKKMKGIIDSLNASDTLELLSKLTRPLKNKGTHSLI